MPTPVAKSPSKGLLDILKAVTGLTTDWDFHVGRLTPDPDRQVVLRHSGGPAGEVKVAIDYPGVQILARGARGEYEAAYQILVSVKEALVAHPGAAEYPEMTSITARGDIVDVGYDDKDRPQFSLNLQLIVTYDTSGYRDY